MPHLAIGGLSESWLLMELGRLHWEHIFDQLDLRPAELIDSDGARIYPTLAAIEWRATTPLSSFREDSVVEICRQSFERSDGYSLSELELRSEKGTIGLQAFSIDAKKAGKTGKQLRRVAAPTVPASIESHPLARTYQESRQRVALAGVLEVTVPESGYEYRHEINPYYEVNGVNLLYFAAHPTIGNLAERALAKRCTAGRLDLAFTHSAISCETAFFRNCDVKDSVICRIDESSLFDPNWQPTEPTRSTVRLYRASDRKLMSIVRSRRSAL
jgi:probable biosynthetic protein (TIGR04098 family)